VGIADSAGAEPVAEIGGGVGPAVGVAAHLPRSPRANLHHWRLDKWNHTVHRNRLGQSAKARGRESRALDARCSFGAAGASLRAEARRQLDLITTLRVGRDPGTVVNVGSFTGS
jgi:hypothetical protein